MSYNWNRFDASKVEPMGDFSLLPPGKYLVAIAGTEMVPTKSLTGSFLKVEFQVTSGEYEGRKLWARLNLDNPNPQAVEIAERELSAICRAVGVLTPRSPRDLEARRLVVNVVIAPGKDGYADSNQIKGYFPADADLYVNEDESPPF